VRRFIFGTHHQILLDKSNQGECGGWGMWHAWEKTELQDGHMKSKIQNWYMCS
jgi:hypothetical protein